MTLDISKYPFKHIPDKPEDFADCTSIIRYHERETKPDRKSKAPDRKSKAPESETLAIIDNLEEPVGNSTLYSTLKLTFLDLRRVHNQFEFIRIGEYWFHHHSNVPFTVYLSANNVSPPFTAILDVSARNIISITGPIPYYPMSKFSIRKRLVKTCTNEMHDLKSQKVADIFKTAMEKALDN